MRCSWCYSHGLTSSTITITSVINWNDLWRCDSENPDLPSQFGRQIWESVECKTGGALQLFQLLVQRRHFIPDDFELFVVNVVAVFSEEDSVFSNIVQSFTDCWTLA